MHADTLRPPRASGYIKISQCQLKAELTTAILAPEACPSVRETYIKEAFVSAGHYSLRPPGRVHCCNRYRSIRLRLTATQTVGGLAFTVTSSIRVSLQRQLAHLLQVPNRGITPCKDITDSGTPLK